MKGARGENTKAFKFVISFVGVVQWSLLAGLDA